MRKSCLLFRQSKLSVKPVYLSILFVVLAMNVLIEILPFHALLWESFRLGMMLDPCGSRCE